jgi:hypothetical protein
MPFQNNARAGELAGKGATMSELKFPEWQTPYVEALVETDERKLVQRVNLAEMAILSRLEAIQTSSDRVEKQAIEDALSGLSVLKMETVKFKRSQSQPVSPSQYRVN